MKRKKQSQSRRETAKKLYRAVDKTICNKCGEYGKHFVPPSLGEDGFYTCQTLVVKETNVRTH